MRVRLCSRGRECQERSKRRGGKGREPHYHGHRERLRERFRDAGADALSDYEMLELVLFRAHSAARREAAGERR